MSVHVIICYDVKTSEPKGARRLRRIAEACGDFGVRVQYSVFECSIEQRDWVVLRARLLTEMNSEFDSLRFYFLDEESFGKREHHGVREPIDPQSILIV